MGTSLVRVVMLMIKKEEDKRGRKCGKVFRTGLPGGPSSLSPHPLGDWQP